MQKTGIKAYAPAKINWSLDIVGRREDGYHLLDMLMQSVELYDELWLRPAAADAISMEDAAGDASLRVAAEDNLAYRAWLLLKDSLGLTQHLQIDIRKRIPSGAGLAGGSSDAAAVLLGACRLFELPLELDELCSLAVQLGADLPFCLCGGLARVRGIGEQLQKVEPAPCYDLLLIKPEVAISTARMYADYHRLPTPPHPDMERISAALLQGEREQLFAQVANHLEPPAFAAFPQVEEIKRRCRELGLPSLMSGSGSTVWALAPNRRTALSLASQLGQDYPFVRAVRSLAHGVLLEDLS